MAREDIPDITPKEKSEIQKMLDEIPWAVGTDPLEPDTPDPPDLAYWTERVAAALRKNGYSTVVTHDPKDPNCKHESTITFNFHGVVVRHHDQWPDGVGCCLYDAKTHQLKTTLLLVRPQECFVGAVKVAKRTVAGNLPPIDVWVLDVAAGTLDMGDGRVIEVQ